MARKPTPKDLEQLQAALRRAHAVLSGDITQLQAEAFTGSGSGDAKELGDGAHHLEFNLELLERDGSALREIEEALERIDQGDYGRCEACEEWIPKARLSAVPHARHCVACQREVEQRGW
jgi:DnaK suppressor protein